MPIDVEGVYLDAQFGSAISPDGRFLAVGGQGGILMVYPSSGGQPRQIPEISTDDRLIRWTADGRGLFVFRQVNASAFVYRLEIATGKRSFVREINVPDPSHQDRVDPGRQDIRQLVASESFGALSGGRPQVNASGRQLLFQASQSQT